MNTSTRDLLAVPELDDKMTTDRLFRARVCPSTRVDGHLVQDKHAVKFLFFPESYVSANHVEYSFQYAVLELDVFCMTLESTGARVRVLLSKMFVSRCWLII